MDAQTDGFTCATTDRGNPDPMGVYSGGVDLTSLNSCDPIVLNIYFWGINRPNGQNDFPNRADDVLCGVANLNILYNEFGIYFKYRGFEEIDSPTLPNDEDGYYVLEQVIDYFNMVTWATNEGFRKPDAFNVYLFGWAGFGGGIAPNLSGSTHCGVNSSGISKVTLVHEIAHNLTIKHTRSSTEHATRDINDPNFNADTAGDAVVDTAANNGFRDNSCACYPFVDLTTCSYIGDEEDNVGVLYDISPLDVNNAMGDAYPCRQIHLTTGQGIRAREALIADVQGNFGPTLTTIASLYEPYAGEYYVTGPEPNPYNPPLFQPGFNYRFLECSCNCPEPSPYEDVSFSYTNNSLLTISKDNTGFSSITHPNHSAIQIDLDLCEPYGQNTRRCYDNWNKAADSGTVTKFEDNVFNNNVTITQKDSLTINNPNFIDNLPQGLYVIDKNYNDGSTNQTVIQKDNN